MGRTKRGALDRHGSVPPPDAPSSSSASSSSAAPAAPAAAAAVSSSLSSSSSSSLARRPWSVDWLMFAAVALGSFAVYATTVYPTLAGGDSGELLAAACGAGVGHPPGYPTLTMLNRAVIAVFPSNPAYAANMLNAAFGALGAAFMALACRQLGAGRAASAIAASLFALSRIVWEYSTHSEVFALHNAIVGATLWLTCTLFMTDDLRLAYAGAFVSGLGGTNQHILIFLAAPVALATLAYYRRELRAKPHRLVRLAACALVGLSPYLQLPVASFMGPRYTWGDQSTLDGFLTHLLRREYGTWQLGGQGVLPDPGRYFDRMKLNIDALIADSSVLGVALALLGVAAAVRASRSRAAGAQGGRGTAVAVLVGSWALYMAVFYYLANLPLEALFASVQARFHMQPHMIVYVFVALGVDAAGDILVAVLGSKRRAAVRVLLAASAVALVAVLLAWRYSEMDRSGVTLMRVHGRTVLDAVPKGGILLIKGDIHHNTAHYAQVCEGYRPDVSLVSIPLMTYAWYVPMMQSVLPNVRFPGERYNLAGPGVFTMRDFLEANWGTGHEIFVVADLDENDPTPEGVFEAIPWGPVRRIIRPGSRINADDYVAKTSPLFANYTRDQLSRTYYEGSWESVLVNDYWEDVHRRGHFLLVQSIKADSQSRSQYSRALLVKAAELFDELVGRMDGPTPPHVLKNIGIAKSRLGLVEEAVRVWTQYLRTDAAKGDKDAAAIDGFVRNYE